jgi:hypothetical protein
MELVHIYNDPTLLQFLFTIFNVIGVIGVIFLCVGCGVAYFTGVDFVEYKKLLFLLIALIIFVTANLNLIDWTSGTVEMYVVNDMDLLQEKLDEYKIINSSGKLYTLKKLPLDN